MKIQDLPAKKMKNHQTLRASSWRAQMNGDNSERQIWHYATLMAVVRKGQLVQVSKGWDSMSDKHGMSKLRKGANLAGLEFVNETA